MYLVQDMACFHCLFLLVSMQRETSELLLPGHHCLKTLFEEGHPLGLADFSSFDLILSFVYNVWTPGEAQGLFDSIDL